MKHLLTAALLPLFLQISIAQISFMDRAFAQTTAEEEDQNYLDDFQGDPEDEVSFEEALEEEPAPLEAPYANAEDIELAKQQTRKQRQRRKKKKSEPLPSVFDDEFNEPDTKGARIKRRYIKHPMASKGLYKITADGDYLYTIPKTPQNATISVRFGVFDAPNLINSANGAKFSDLYGGNDPILFFTYEWKLDHWMRNLSFNIGSGLLIASGNGRIESGDKAGQESQEKFTFGMLPNHLGLGYKFKYSDTQKLVPYIEGGLGYYVFTEHRDDGEPVFGRWGGAAVAHAVGGVAFSISELDRDSSIRLDADYGINGVWLTAEVRQLIGGIGSFDFTSTLLNAGVMVHF